MTDRNAEAFARRAEASAARAEPLRPLAEQGLSAARIAPLVGMSRAAVVALCKRNRIALHGNDFRKPTNASGSQDLNKTFSISRMTGFNAAGPLTGDCIFPLWGDERPTGKFCSKKVRAPGEPYCARHMAATHQKPQPMTVPERAA